MRLDPRWGAALVLLLWPGIALAHTPYPGIRGFYIGALHPLTTPAHILVIVALSLWLGIRQREARARSLLTLFFSVCLGLLLAYVLAPLLPTPLLLLLMTTALGLLSVLPMSLPIWLFPTLTGLTGFLLAMESIPEAGPFMDVFVTTLGSLAGIQYLILYGSEATSWAWERWQSQMATIVVRVAGSWIAAIGCMMLAFRVSGIV